MTSGVDRSHRAARRARAGRRGGLAALVVVLALLAVATVGLAAARAKVDELCKALLEDGNYKVRVQAALVLGRLKDPTSVGSLVRALKDSNPTVRGIAAQSLGKIGDRAAIAPLRALLTNEQESFVRAQAEKALAALGPAPPSSPQSTTKATGPKPKVYLAFGPFTGGVKSAGPEAARLIREALQRELSKLPIVTLTLTPAEQKSFAATGLLGLYIDGNITRLDDTPAGGVTETSCDVRVMVARWPSKSIIMWTNAGASLQSGSRPRDKENARRDCLEASAGQLSEDLSKFLKSQGGG